MIGMYFLAYVGSSSVSERPCQRFKSPAPVYEQRHRADVRRSIAAERAFIDREHILSPTCEVQRAERDDGCHCDNDDHARSGNLDESEHGEIVFSDRMVAREKKMTESS